MQKETVDFNGGKIAFFVQRKNVKNINLRVDMNKNVTVSIPLEMKIDVVKDFIKQKAKWIKKQQEFYESFEEKKENITFENGETIYLLGKQYKVKLIPDKQNNIAINNKYFEIHIKEKYVTNKEYIKKVYDKWLREYAERLFKEQVEKYIEVLNKYKISTPMIEIRDMKSRWGSCIPVNKKVIFNLKLIKTPICCIEYVVLHELAHFKHSNHSKSFYNFITIFMPDWKERKKILDEEYMGII